MSYRLKMKADSSGNLTDLPLDAETVKGVDVVNSKLSKTSVTTETWTFTLDDDSQVTKKIMLSTE